eukprot:11375639-Heterocapsa_arctica.AAC.1
MTLSPPRPSTPKRPTSSSSMNTSPTRSSPATETSRSTARLATAWPTSLPRAVGCPPKRS